MKNIITLLLILLPSLSVAIGNDQGNGGNNIIQDFVVSGLQIGNFLKRNHDIASKSGVDTEILIQAIRTTEIYLQDRCILNGQPVDAVNFPNERRVCLSEVNWNNISLQPDAIGRKQALALHEYLWIAGVDDINYQVSSSILVELKNELILLAPSAKSTALAQALCEATEEHDYQTANAILQLRFDVNQPICKFGKTAFFYVLDMIVSGRAKQDDLGFLQTLLNAGADPNSLVDFNFDRVRPIVLSIWTGSKLLNKLLLDFGADLNVYRGRYFDHDPTHSDASSFYEALRTRLGDMDPQFLGWLIDNGANVNRQVTMSAGWTSSSVSPADMILKSNRTDLTSMLISKNVIDWCAVEREKISSVNLPLAKAAGGLDIVCPK